MSLPVGDLLIDCCRMGKIEDVKNILAHYKLSTHSKWDDGYVPLCEALKNQQTEIVKLLLQYEAKVNMTKNEGSESGTPLHYAAQMKNIELLQILLDKKADLNVKNNKGETVLHLAVIQQDEEMVKLLLAGGADVESTDINGYTSLHMAAMNGNVKIVQYLISHKADVNCFCKNDTALHFAVKNNNLDIVKLLIHVEAIDGLNLRSYYQLLDIAVGKLNHTILEVLLESIYSPKYTTNDEQKKVRVDFPESKEDPVGKEDPNSSKYCTKINIKDIVKLDERVGKSVHGLLHKVMLQKKQEKQIEVIRVLLSNNFNVNAQNKQGRTALYYAYTSKQVETCKYLLANEANINVDRHQNLLHMSVENKDEEFTKFLLEQGADVNARTNDGSTSLHLACRSECEQIVKLLLNYKIDVNLKNNKGLSSLHLAVNANSEEMVLILLRYGSFVNITTTTTKCTPLHFAVRYNRETIVTNLLQFGADVNAEDINYKSALYCAIEARKTNVVRILVEHDKDVQNRSKKLALCLAVVSDYLEEIVKILLLHGYTVQPEDFKEFSLPKPLQTQYVDEYYRSKYEIIFKDILKCEPSIIGFFEYQVLQNSVKKGCLKIVQDLLRPDANVNVRMEKGISFLDLALSSGQMLVAEEFLRRGASLDLDYVYNDGNTLLHDCCVRDCQDIVSFLLEQGADVKKRNSRLDTPLHVASAGCVKVAELLLDAGADISSKDDRDFTPLHVAAYWGVNDVAELLLEYDADINAKNSKNATPLDLALYWDRGYVTNILLDHGAQYDFDLNCYVQGCSYNLKNLLEKHSITLQAIRMPNVETDCGRNQYYLLECFEEINRMVQCQIGINVSLYDFLRKRDATVELYMRNEQIVSSLESKNLKSYNKYFGMLQARINRAKRRTILLRLASDSLESVLHISLPYTAKQEILSYITNLDLRNLISASEVGDSVDMSILKQKLKL